MASRTRVASSWSEHPTGFRLPHIGFIVSTAKRLHNLRRGPFPAAFPVPRNDYLSSVARAAGSRLFSASERLL